MKINPWIIALVIVGLFLTWILFRGCTPATDHSGEKKSIDSTAKYWQIRHKSDSLYADSMAKVDASKDTVISSLRQRITITETEAFRSQVEAHNLAQIILSRVDTPTKLMACDSLAVIVNAQTFQVHALTELTDSIIAQYTRKLEIRQDVLSRLEASYNEQNKVLAETTQKYDGLYKDYAKQVKANKFNKTLSRILAGTVLVLGGALLLK